MNILTWIQEWYNSNCNGDWEHSYGIKVDNIDNPGWRITIDLEETYLADLEIEYKLIEKSDEDWLGFKVENSKFIGFGDPFKLEEILFEFRKIAESQTNFGS